MSTIVIVSVCAAIAAIIGLRVYFEHRQEDDEDVFSDLQSFVINPYESTVTPAVVDEKLENQLAADTQAPAAVEVEPINSAAALTEAKPKKKKRYYYPNKKQAAKSKDKKQTKK